MYHGTSPFVIETAGAARFIEDLARSRGNLALAERAGDAALHLSGVEGLTKGERTDQKRILGDGYRTAAETLLREMIATDELMAPAAEAVLVELTDPDRFWDEINTAKALSKAGGLPTVPDDIRSIEGGFYATGPVSAVDIPVVSS